MVEPEVLLPLYLSQYGHQAFVSRYLQSHKQREFTMEWAPKLSACRDGHQAVNTEWMASCTYKRTGLSEVSSGSDGRVGVGAERGTAFFIIV